MSFAGIVRASLVHEMHRHAGIGVRYSLTKSDVMLMVKTICRDYGRNTGTSERNVKSGKRPKSKSPSESPAARPTPSANDLTPSRRTTTAADGEDVPSTTRHSTPMTWAMIWTTTSMVTWTMMVTKHALETPVGSTGVRDTSLRSFELQCLLKPFRCGFELFKTSVSRHFGHDFNDDNKVFE